MFEVQILLDRSMTHQDDDVDLVHRIAAGDEDALRELYAAYGQRLYAYALRLTGDPAAAEDVVQDSLVTVWQGACRFRGEGRVVAWLLGIIHHKALNSLRSRPLISFEATETDPPARDPLPDEQISTSEQSRLIRAGLERLSLEHRTALELIFYQGLSLDEAAEVCGVAVGTIKSRLSYAKASLRGVLNREGLSAEDVG